MVQQNHRTIVVSDRNYETLRNLGTITDSFNDVISKLLENQNQKAASGLAKRT
jgi:predicted CopG family antitoxin